MFTRLPIPRTSFLDSRLRLRGRVDRLLERGMSTSDTQLDPVAHIGKPGSSSQAPSPDGHPDAK